MKILINDRDIANLKLKAARIGTRDDYNTEYLYKVYNNGVASKAYLLFYSYLGSSR